MMALSKQQFRIFALFFVVCGIIGATIYFDIIDQDFSRPKLEQKEDILFAYNPSNGNFILYPGGSDKESYHLPTDTKMNISVIRMSQYGNNSFVNLTIPNNVKYDYLRGFISMSKNKTLVLSWR